MNVIINPGSGPVAGATYENAAANIHAFAREAGADHWDGVGSADTERDGRWTFFVERGDQRVEIQMPGLPLDEVRYVDGLNPWDFPRLYVDGSSWLWEFALRVVWRRDDEDDA